MCDPLVLPRPIFDHESTPSGPSFARIQMGQIEGTKKRTCKLREYLRFKKRCNHYSKTSCSCFRDISPQANSLHQRQHRCCYQEKRHGRRSVHGNREVGSSSLTIKQDTNCTTKYQVVMRGWRGSDYGKIKSQWGKLNRAVAQR